MIELNKIYCGDCLEVMTQIEDKSVDMILCDLPYGTTACKWDTIIPFDKLWEQYKRIIKPNRVIVLTCSQPFTSFLLCSNADWFRHEWIWDKKSCTNAFGVKYSPMKRHENILVFSTGKISTFNRQKTPKDKKDVRINSAKRRLHKNADITSEVYGSRTKCFHAKDYDPFNSNPVSIIYFERGNKKKEHPTQKPIALFEYLIKTYTNEGETVLDNCIGSGTTAMACKNTNRNFIGIEKEQEYVDVANKRLNETIPQTSLF
jgi:site-specific DNA-methyltransferase (adenine-specific)